MRNLATLCFLLASLAFFGLGIFATKTSASLSATCFCKISKDRLDGVVTATGVIKDLTGEVNKTYTFQGETQQGMCKGECSNTANKYVKSQAVAAAACAANVPDSTSIYVYSAVGTKAYREVRPIGRLKNSPAVAQTTCTCPPSWYSDTNVLGGVTTNGTCKKLACGPLSITPLPPDGTQVGSWGFTWGNTIWAYSSNANGGAPTCSTTVISPALCSWY